MAEPKRIRWSCPAGEHPGALAPSRLRKIDIRRFCIPCSESKGVNNMEKILLEQNGYILKWEETPHDGPPILVLKTTSGGYIGNAIIDAIANLEDYYNRLEQAKKSAKDAVLAVGRLLEKLDPNVLEQKGKQK